MSVKFCLQYCHYWLNPGKSSHIKWFFNLCQFSWYVNFRFKLFSFQLVRIQSVCDLFVKNTEILMQKVLWICLWRGMIRVSHSSMCWMANSAIRKRRGPESQMCISLLAVLLLLFSNPCPVFIVNICSVTLKYMDFREGYLCKINL